MQIVIDIPIPSRGQNIINIPIHFCGGQVVEAGGYGFEERKTGKWEYFNLFRTCSVCRKTTGEKDDFNDWIPNKYCPYCGAKMEVDE